MLTGYNLITQCMYTMCSHLRVVTYISTNERDIMGIFFRGLMCSQGRIFIHALKLSSINLLGILDISILSTWIHL